MRRPETRYARADGRYVAWQAFGDGPRDILFVTSWATNIDAMWDEPSCALFFERLSRIGRVICFDKRGTGVSDPVSLTSLPTLEQWMDDALAALDAAQSRRAVVIGDTEGGPDGHAAGGDLPRPHPGAGAGQYLCALAARARLRDRHARSDRRQVARPVRASLGPGSRHAGAHGPKRGRRPPHAGVVHAHPAVRHAAGSRDAHVSLGSRPGRPLHPARHFRAHARPAPAREPPLPARVRSLPGREHPGCTVARIAGRDCFPLHPAERRSAGRDPRFRVGRASRHARGTRTGDGPFTDVVGSTRIVAEIGDARWLEMRAVHDAIVRRNLQKFRGVEIERTGDGVLATFDGPARAVHCAVRIRDEVRASVSRYAQACTPARSSVAARKSAASRSISRRGSSRSRAPARCWCRAP